MEPDSPVSEEKTVKAEEGVTASNIKNTVFKCKELVGVKFLIFHGNPSVSPFFFCSWLVQSAQLNLSKTAFSL